MQNKDNEEARAKVIKERKKWLRLKKRLEKKDKDYPPVTTEDIAMEILERLKFCNKHWVQPDWNELYINYWRHIPESWFNAALKILYEKKLIEKTQFGKYVAIDQEKGTVLKE